MKSKRKKIITGIILSLMLVFMSGSQLVNASDIQPKGPLAYCSKCKTTTNHVYSTTRTYEHDETFPCTHGKTIDRYKVYKVKTVLKCTQCGGTTQVVDEYEDHVFVGCE